MNYLQNKFWIGAYDPATKKWVDALKKLKITVNPYVFFLEELSDDMTSPRIDDEFDNYTVDFLGPEDMKSIEGLPGRISTEAGLRNRLKEDKVGIGVKLAQKLVAFTWYDLKELNCKGIKCPLNKGEAYLFDAYTLLAFRGKGIAPFMRYRSYQELTKLGKHSLFSFSDFFNTPAIRFKEKLKAKPLELRLEVRFRGIHLDFRLKKYTKSKSKFRIIYLRILVKGVKFIDSYQDNGLRLKIVS
jgi:hypothetical protein